MCGIAGIFLNSASSKESLVSVVTNMTNSLHHRGPDGTGIWNNNEEGIALGHKRLSILDLSKMGAQPMYTKNNRYAIVYNGEIYNYKELQKELEQLNQIKWNGTSDTEVALAAIEYWGIETAVSKFVGMFAFALWDNEERLLHLVRDRMGIKPLYWSMKDNSFIFGSELKSLMTSKKCDFKIDKKSLSLFMKYKYVPCPSTIFKNVYQLEPATILTIDKNKNIKKTKYWNLTEVARSGLEYANINKPLLDDEIFDLIECAVKCRLVSDTPIGAFLSGGIDSSAVVALMQKNNSLPVNTFSMGFSIDSYDESEYAREVAQYLGTNHTEYILEPRDAINLIPNLPKIYDEPFSDSSQIPTYLLSKLTSKNVKVALSGDGGDEVFGGYNRYLYADKYLDKFNRMPLWLQKSLQNLIYSFPKEKWSNLFNCLPKKYSHSQGGDKLYKLASVIGKDNIEIYQKLISDWQFTDGLIYSDDEYQENDYDSNPYFSGKYPVEYMQLMDQMHYLPDDILRKIDRASMANSLEVRVPLLDHRIIEKLWNLPRECKINNGVSKVILRKILGKYVPSVNFQRKKAGFSLPISEWLRGPLREWAEGLLSRDLIMRHGLLNPEVINNKWNEHQTGKNNWHEHIWSVLMFNGWYEHWVEKN